MASLKEIKTRLSSVKNTRKITSAMKLVASSKLHRVQQSIESMLPYEQRLDAIMKRLVNGMSDDISSPFAQKREVKRVALLAFSSNSSLCGAFNANAIKTLKHEVQELERQSKEVVVIPIGRKIAEAANKMNVVVGDDFSDILNEPNYIKSSTVAKIMMQKFIEGEYDEIKLVYNHFKSTSTQVMTVETYLPIQLNSTDQEENVPVDYIVEPSIEELVGTLIPKNLHLKIFTVTLDSIAAEYSARTIAMQIATDNADDMIQDLTLQYNTQRQQAITNELLDIIGGTVN